MCSGRAAGVVCCLSFLLWGSGARASIFGVEFPSDLRAQGGVGSIQLSSADSLETNKTGYKFTFSLQNHRSMWGGLTALGLGTQFSFVSGSKGAVKQELEQQGMYIDVAHLRNIWTDGLHLGPWLHVPIGYGALLQYNNPTEIQIAPHLGLQVYYQFSEALKDFGVSAGVAWQPRIDSMSSMVGLLQLSYALFTSDSGVQKAEVPVAPMPSESAVATSSMNVAEVIMGSQILIFEIDSNELRSEARQFITELTSTLNQNSSVWDEVRIQGYSSGNEKPEVAVARAEAVRSAFEKAGLKMDRVRVSDVKANPEGQSSQRVDVIVRSSNQGASTVLNPLAQKWENYTYRFSDPALFFQSGKADLTKEARRMMKRLGKTLNKNTEAWEKVIVYGFTDSTGLATKNVILAKKRAQAGARIFMQSGISRSKVEAVGMTSEDQVGSESQESRRRVEIEILGVKDREQVRLMIETAKKDGGDQ